MRGVTPPLPQYVFMSWYLMKLKTKAGLHMVAKIKFPAPVEN
jgi:hypothetical protein